MIAVALSLKARALIQADRIARRPTNADRVRVEAALRARLGPGVLPVESEQENVSSISSWRLRIDGGPSEATSRTADSR